MNCDSLMMIQAGKYRLNAAHQLRGRGLHAAHRFVLAHGANLPQAIFPRVNAEDIWAFNLLNPDATRVKVQELT